ncbi:MAG: hypothetical protein AAF092_05060 [Pseudomonadota bacterium]
MLARLLGGIAIRRLGLWAGAASLALAALWAWHEYDKRQAVNAAREGFVRAFELEASQAELAALRARMASTQEANRALQKKVQLAEGTARRFAAELEAFEDETQVNPDGLVDADLMRRLRSN